MLASVHLPKIYHQLKVLFIKIKLITGFSGYSLKALGNMKLCAIYTCNSGGPEKPINKEYTMIFECA